MPAQPNRRRVRIVDHVLQKAFMVALVIMETVGVAIAIWMLYKALGEVVDENIYRVHFSGNVKIMSLLLTEGMRVLGAMLLVNVAALIIADRIWAFYVKGILTNLGALMTASRHLDFTPRPPMSFHHAVLEQALAWREFELRRLSALRDQVRALPAQLPAAAHEREAARALLQRMTHE